MNSIYVLVVVLLYAAVLPGEPVKILHGKGKWMTNSKRVNVHKRIEKRSPVICDNPNSTLTSLEKAECVTAHNDLRKSAGNVSAADEAQMVWDDTLANLAQKLADKCKFEHADFITCAGDAVGQNLAVTTSQNPTPKLFIESWYNEVHYYNYTTGGCTLTEENRSCGHYTQVVWHTTNNVGCGMKHCDSVIIDEANNIIWYDATLFVCNYHPPGNYIGQQPYVSGAPCTACGNVFHNNTYKCKNDLCAGCDPLEDSDCQCIRNSCEKGHDFDSTKCACKTCEDEHCGITCGKQNYIPKQHCAAFKHYGYCGADSLYHGYMRNKCFCTCNETD